jgi:hypothetical protein
MMLIKLRSDGQREVSAIVVGPSLIDLQTMVGGYVEIVPHWKTYQGQLCIAYANEEGKVKGLPFNLEATELWYKQLQYARQQSVTGDILVGDIAIVTGTSAELKQFVDSDESEATEGADP